MPTQTTIHSDVLEVWQNGPPNAKLPFGKRRTAGDTGQLPAVMSVKTQNMSIQKEQHHGYTPHHNTGTQHTQDTVYTNGKVNGIATSILVDTGSAVTIIHCKLWGRGRPDRRNLNQSSVPVVVANREPLRTLGSTEVILQLAGHHLKQKVLVTEDISHDCLLGADFLASHGAVIDLKNDVLQINRGSAPLRQLDKVTSNISYSRKRIETLRDSVRPVGVKQTLLHIMN